MKILALLAILPLPLTVWCACAYLLVENMAVPGNMYDKKRWFFEVPVWEKVLDGSILMVTFLVCISLIIGIGVVLFNLFGWGLHQLTQGAP